MKIPLSPPDFESLAKAATGDLAKNPEKIMLFLLGPADKRGRYLHWDELRHLRPPDGLTLEEWWFGMKIARRKLEKKIGLADKNGCTFSFCIIDEVERELHNLDKQAAGQVTGFLHDKNRDTTQSYIVKALFEEAITSSQLEGASTTRAVAREMLAEGRKPLNSSEQMIFNNYKALMFIKDKLGEAITPSLIFELHRIITDKTLENPAKGGVLRGKDDNIIVYDSSDGTQVHVPPGAETLDRRLEKLCEFANGVGKEGPFVHPLIRAILVHFLLAYDHPFVDGNGRTARALFYWVALKNGYWLIEYLSISAEIMRARRQYDRSFLYVETDGCDTTYFVLFQIEIIKKAIEKFLISIKQKAEKMRETETVLSKLRQAFNYRQMELLRHALKHDDDSYTIESHRAMHNVSYNTARTDLLELYRVGLLVMKKRNRKMLFYKNNNNKIWGE